MMADDPYKKFRRGVTSPAQGIISPIVPDDINDLPKLLTLLTCTADGVAQVVMRDGSSGPVPMVAGQSFPAQVARVLTTSTGSYIGWY